MAEIVTTYVLPENMDFCSRVDFNPRGLSKSHCTTKDVFKKEKKPTEGLHANMNSSETQKARPDRSADFYFPIHTHLSEHRGQRRLFNFAFPSQAQALKTYKSVSPQKENLHLRAKFSKKQHFPPPLTELRLSPSPTLPGASSGAAGCFPY